MSLHRLLQTRLAEYANWQVHEVSADVAVTELAKDIAARLQQAIDIRGCAVLSVSGGKSPIVLFEHLRALDVDWSKVTLTLVDERCVPNTHEASNALLVRQHLCQGAAKDATLITMVPDECASLDSLLSPTELAEHAHQALAQADIADVMILGMGADGHTASLFAQAPALAQALDLKQPARCLAMELPEPPANAPFARITQTLRQILNSRHLILPLNGQDKLHTLQAVLQGQDLPIAHVLNQHLTCIDLWISP